MSARSEHSLIQPATPPATLAVGGDPLESPRGVAPVIESRIVDGGHARRVGDLSAMLARAIGLPEEQARRLRRAAPFHDIGLIGVPRAILDKPGRLTPEEFDLVEQHTELGAMLFSHADAAVTRTARLIAWMHHERFDGSGYPNRLVGDAIPLEGRIVAIADVFDALTRRRPHRPARSVEEALTALRRRSGSAFDPALVMAFFKALGEGDYAGATAARPLDLSGLGLAAPGPVAGVADAPRLPIETLILDGPFVLDDGLTLVPASVARKAGDGAAERKLDLVDLFVDTVSTLPSSSTAVEPAAPAEPMAALLLDDASEEDGVEEDGVEEDGVAPTSDQALETGLPIGDAMVRRRIANALTQFGYRIEELAFGRMLARADLGRRSHSVLIHVLPMVARSTLWSVEQGRTAETSDCTQLVSPVDVEPHLVALQAARRRAGATYLAIFGDKGDLDCLQEPAGSLGATLWPWDAVDRARDLSCSLLVDPIDLEPHFAAGGFLKGGFERFERTVLARIAERGSFSSVLSRLATLPAPTVFLAHDLAAELHLPSARLLELLERLTEAPYQLLTHLDGDEFCLRYPVSDALVQLSEYALNLRARLPSRAR